MRGPGGGEGSPRVLLFQFSTGPKGIHVPGAGSWGEGSPDPRGLPLAWKDACCRAAARPVDPGTSDAGAAACRLRGGGGCAIPCPLPLRREPAGLASEALLES